MQVICMFFPKLPKLHCCRYCPKGGRLLTLALLRSSANGGGWPLALFLLTRYSIALRGYRCYHTRVMSNTSLTPELVKLTTELANAFAQSQKVISANARIRLLYQTPEATELFRKVDQYGEELRNKHMAGMPPSEEEIAKFDGLRQDVVSNDICRGFLEARQELDQLLATVQQYLYLAIEKGESPTDEEVAESMQQQVSACSCGGGCHGNCDDCDSDCAHHEADSEEHECRCGGHGEGHECCGGHGEGHECCGGHGEGHECKCGKH